MNHLKPALVAVLLGLIAFVAGCGPTPAADCRDWNTAYFFEIATVGDVERCLATGADLEARDKNGVTPLHFAAANNYNAVVQTLIDAGADVNARSKDGWTPLHAAARYSDNPAMVQTLIDAGADVEARHKDGWTPLHIAALNTTPAVVQTLIDAGADIGARDKYGLAPFDLILDDSPLVGTRVYRLLKEGRFK